MRKWLLIVISIFLISCKKEKVVDNLVLYNGVSEITKCSDNSYAFLANLKEYNNIISLCFINENGELIKVNPIDKYHNVDISQGFIKLIKYNNHTIIIYENRSGETVFERYINCEFYKKNSINTSNDTYGSFISLTGKSRGVYLRNSLFYYEDKHKEYKYEYLNLDIDLSIIDRKVISLGYMYPSGMTIINNRVYYYTEEKRLHYRDFDSKESQPVYTFDKDIIDLTSMGEYLLVLLIDSIYIVSPDGLVDKGFKLSEDDSEYRAESIPSSDGKTIIVRLKSDYNSKYKIFTNYGSQLDEIVLEKKFIGDSYLTSSFTGGDIIHSDGKSLYFDSY